jgi:hypothetical protein
MHRSPSFTAPFVLILSLLLAATALAEESAPADPGRLIDRVIEAYGGREALARVQSYAFAGTLMDRDRFHSDPVPVLFSRTFVRKDRLKVVITRPEGSEVRILSGNKGWRSGRAGGPPAQVEGPQYNAMVLQAARADLPWLLLDKRAEIKSAPPLVISEVDMENRTVVHTLAVLEVPLRDGMSLKVMVEEKSAQIQGVAGYDTNDPARPPVFETHYLGFRKEDGVLFPATEVTFAGKVQTGLMLINTIALNPPLGEDEFRP